MIPLAFNILLTCIYNPPSVDLNLCVLKHSEKPALLLHLMSRMLFLECKLYGTLEICKSWEMSSIGRFCGNCGFCKEFKEKI